MAKSIGTSIKRREDPRFIQGRGSYVANLVLPKMAYLAIKRSPYAHARIKSIDTSYTWSLGDKAACDKAFAEADHVVELEFVNQRLIATAMEPRAAVAQWDSSKEEMTLWTTSQNPNLTRVVLSAFVLFVPEHK